jgi:hypothetical protein
MRWRTRTRFDALARQLEGGRGLQAFLCPAEVVHPELVAAEGFGIGAEPAAVWVCCMAKLRFSQKMAVGGASAWPYMPLSNSSEVPFTQDMA